MCVLKILSFILLSLLFLLIIWIRSLCVFSYHTFSKRVRIIYESKLGGDAMKSKITEAMVSGLALSVP